MKNTNRLLPLMLLLGLAPHLLRAQTTAAPSVPAPIVPEWAYPGSSTHVQVPPPPDFHRPSRIYDTPIGIFQGQADVGSALVAGSATYDAHTKQYTIESAGYNIWYTRDEFRFLWKKMSGDVSLAADIAYPDPNGFHDHKAVLIIRQSLDDGSREVMVALHGAGMIHLAERPETNASVSDMEYRIGSRDVYKRQGPVKRICCNKNAGGDISMFLLPLAALPNSMKGQPCACCHRRFGNTMTTARSAPR